MPGSIVWLGGWPMEFVYDKDAVAFGITGWGEGHADGRVQGASMPKNADQILKEAGLEEWWNERFEVKQEEVGIIGVVEGSE